MVLVSLIRGGLTKGQIEQNNKQKNTHFHYKFETRTLSMSSWRFKFYHLSSDIRVLICIIISIKYLKKKIRNENIVLMSDIRVLTSVKNPENKISLFTVRHISLYN